MFVWQSTVFSSRVCVHEATAEYTQLVILSPFSSYGHKDAHTFEPLVDYGGDDDDFVLSSF